MIKKSTAILCVILLMMTNLSSIHGATLREPPVSVRIGLVTYFEYVSNIHFYNSTVVPGFYEEDVFYPETIVTTDHKEFWFSPAQKLYLESEQNFATYEAALSKSAPLRVAGYKAYPTLIARNTWKVFVGHKDTSGELDGVLASINGLDGLTYSQAPVSSERLFLESYDNDPLLIENRYNHTAFGTADVRGDDAVIDLGKRSYRGYIEVGRYGRNDLTAVNIIDLDDYLYSVVMSEVYAKWPEESLKAQSVAARTFAVFYKDIARKYPNDPFDLDDTVSSQVYKGYSIEDQRVNDAVDATSGELIYFDGEVIAAYFFAASGGRTENSESVWSGSVAYLKSVPDIYEDEPERYPWIMEFTPGEIQKALGERGIDIGTVVNIEADGYTDAGRVIDLIIEGTAGNYTLKKETMRYWLGIHSRKFEIIKTGDQPTYGQSVMSADGITTTIDYRNAYVVNGSGQMTGVLDDKEQVIIMGTENIINQPMVNGQSGVFLLAGQGWGHGAGMSQAGAKGMANVGFTYREILEYYYSGTVVQ